MIYIENKAMRCDASEDMGKRKGSNADIRLMKEAIKKIVDNTDNKGAIERMYKSIQAVYVNH